jgi:hypothetical protein
MPSSKEQKKINYKNNTIVRHSRKQNHFEHTFSTNQIKLILSDIIHSNDKLSKRIVTINTVNLGIIKQFYSIFSKILSSLYNNPILEELYDDEHYNDLDIINNCYENFKFNDLTQKLNDLSIFIETQFNTVKELIDKFMNKEYTLNNITELYKIKTIYSTYNDFTSLSDYMNPLYIECYNLYSLSHQLLNNTCVKYSDYIPSSVKETIFDNLKTTRLLFHQIKDNITHFELLVNDNN